MNIMLRYKFETVNDRDFDDILDKYKEGPDPPEAHIRVAKR